MSLGLRGQEAKHALGSSAVQAWTFFFHASSDRSGIK